MSGAPLIVAATVSVYHPFVCGPLACASMSPVDSRGTTDSMKALLLVTATLPEPSTTWMNHSTLVPTSGPAPLQRGERCDISIDCQASGGCDAAASTPLLPRVVG